MVYSIGQLWTGAQNVARWRRVYSNSPKSFLERVIPFVGTNSIMFNFTFHGMTEKSIHSTNLLFLGCKIVNEPPQDPSSWIKVPYNGIDYYIRKVSLGGQGCLVRCSCTDFRHTFAYPNYSKGALFGPRPQAYVRKTPNPPLGRPPRNPGNHAGICKHLANAAQLLQASGWTQSSSQFAMHPQQ